VVRYSMGSHLIEMMTFKLSMTQFVVIVTLIEMPLMKRQMMRMAFETKNFNIAWNQN
jgi:hypothetical protein